MRQRPAQLQSISIALDGSRHADAAESEDASLGSHYAVSTGGGTVVLGDERECVWYEVVCGWVGRHERVGAADGGAGHDSRLVGQRDGAPFDGAGELGSLPLSHFSPPPQHFATPGARFLPSVQ